MCVCVCESSVVVNYFAVFHGIAVVCLSGLPRQPYGRSHWRREGLSDVDRGRKRRNDIVIMCLTLTARS